MTFLAKIMALGVVIYLIKVFLYPIYKPTSKKQKKRAQQFVKDRKKEQAKQRSKSRKRAFKIKLSLCCCKGSFANM